VRYINDSKATNTAATSRALAAFDAPLRVIVGGSLKGEDFGALAASVPGNVLAFYLIGEATEQLVDALSATGIPIEPCGDLPTAIARAHGDARSGEIVLLSPACASFDQFRDFEHRGEEFRHLVQNLTG
jgi:UDP-N-acetylmuramoylalanine--D-glutamate ligase